MNDYGDVGTYKIDRTLNFHGRTSKFENSF